jgi:hypothetical protein
MKEYTNLLDWKGDNYELRSEKKAYIVRLGKLFLAHVDIIMLSIPFFVYY